MHQKAAARRRTAGRPRLVIVGASGSIGTAVCRDLADDYEIVALTRFDARAGVPEPELPVVWRQCDLFSRVQSDAALEGADYVIYLVHTRLPSARLDQAQCEDMDLLIADNFARAASRHSVKQIICLRGLLPDGEMPPELWQRRREVMHALGAHGTPVTVLRASLVVAPGSTGVNLIASLVTRAPIVPVPRWALGRKQPIALHDFLRAVRHCVGNPDSYNQSFDIGGPKILDWRHILKDAAELLGSKAPIVIVPWLPRRLYALWIRYTSRATHPAMIRLLIEDLHYDTVARDNPLQRLIALDAIESRKAIEPYVTESQRHRLRNPRSAILSVHGEQLRESGSVRSIQRLRLPAGRNATWVAHRYFRWLPRAVWPLVVYETERDGLQQVHFRFMRLPILTLTFQPQFSSSDRRMYFITGGLLASGPRNGRGRMEFHDVLDGHYTIAAIHDFAPSLPWKIYQATQAVVHGIVMRAFQRYMERLARRGGG